MQLAHIKSESESALLGQTLCGPESECFILSESETSVIPLGCMDSVDWTGMEWPDAIL